MSKITNNNAAGNGKPKFSIDEDDGYMDDTITPPNASSPEDNSKDQCQPSEAMERVN